LQPGKSSWAAAFTHFVDVAGVIDYTYDDEGRMEFDANKSLNFVYNHLDLVKTASSGTEVNFIWDATGRKIAKTFGGHITHYIGGVEYLDDVLISIATAEGIVRKTQLLANEGDWVYDYYLKDHLGNIRAIITEERSAIVSDKVTSEIVKRLQEEMGFDNVDETAGMAPYLYPYDPSDPDNEMVAELNAYTGRIIGPSKLMSVREGETIDLSTNYWYHELPGENPISDLTEILAGILLNMGAASSGIIPAGPEAGMALLNNVNGTQFNALSGFLDDAFDEVDLTDPQAYLVYMFFDKNNMKIISEKSGIIQVGEADQLGVISQKDLIMDRDGFFYVYVTNRSQLSVSFDNLEVKRWKPVVRVAYDYYPYGLTWENPALPSTEEGIHDCTYQDKEFQFGEFSDGHGLALYDFHARMYDGATGRWLVPDPAAQFANPYLAMLVSSYFLRSEKLEMTIPKRSDSGGNNPVSMIDPDGRFVNEIFDALEYIKPVVVKPIYESGTDKKGLGWEISIGIPKIIPLSYRWEYGRVKYKNGYGDKSGTQIKRGAEVSYLGIFSDGGTNYSGSYASGEFTQTTETITIGVPYLNVKYENDIMPWTTGPSVVQKMLTHADLGLVPNPDQGDRFRSAGLRMQIGLLSWGFELFTGDPGFRKEDRLAGPHLDSDNGAYELNLDGSDPNKYREGIIYIGIGPIRFGGNNEANRHRIQNRMAHDAIDVPWFQVLEIPNKKYFYFGTGVASGVY